MRRSCDVTAVVVEAPASVAALGSAAAWARIEASLDPNDYIDFAEVFKNTQEGMEALSRKRQLEAWAGVMKYDLAAVTAFLQTAPFPALDTAVRSALPTAEAAQRNTEAVQRKEEAYTEEAMKGARLISERNLRNKLETSGNECRIKSHADGTPFTIEEANAIVSFLCGRPSSGMYFPDMAKAVKRPDKKGYCVAIKTMKNHHKGTREQVEVTLNSAPFYLEIFEREGKTKDDLDSSGHE